MDGEVVVALVGAGGSIVAAWFAYRSSTRAARVSAHATERENDREDFTVIVDNLRTDLDSTRTELREARADIRVLVGWMRLAIPLMRQHDITPPPVPEKFDVY